jgi:hypothetical protein
MTHARQQIREAVAIALTGLTTTGTRVFQSRMRPQGDAALPCLLITTDTEQIDTGPQTLQQRAITITVRGMAKAATTLDDTLDTIAAEVETAAHAAGTLAGRVAGGLQLRRIETDFDETLDKPVGVIVLEYMAVYFTNAGAPGAIV